MSIHALWQYQKWVLFPAVFLLATCSEEVTSPITIKNGLYLPENIAIEYTRDDRNNIDPEAKIATDKQIARKIQESYYEINGNRLIIYRPIEDESGIITPENIAITSHSSYLLKPDHEGNISVMSADFDACKTISCDVKFTLKSAESTDSRIVAIENTMLETLQNQSTHTPPITIDIPEETIKATIEAPFWGVPHAITDDIVLKLSPAQSNGLIYGIPEHTALSAFELNGITINPESDEIEVLSFYTNTTPSNTVHLINTYTYLFIIPTDEPLDIHLSEIRPKDFRYLSLDQGFIAEDHNGFYAINTYHFPKIGQSVIALTEGLLLDEVIAHFSALETLENRVMTAKSNILVVPYEISLQDFELALPTLESRYNMPLEQLFRVDQVFQNYTQEITRIIESQALFLKSGPHTNYGYHHFQQPMGDYRFNDTYIRIHNDNIKNVLKAVRAANRHENGDKATHDLWVSPIYVYSIQPNEASGLSYFKEIQPGITLEIFSPASQGHTAEKVLFGKMLQQFNVSNLPKIPVESIANIGKYSLPSLQDPSHQTATLNSEMVINLDKSDVDSNNADDNKASFKNDNNADTQLEEKSLQGSYRFMEGETDRHGQLLK